jgi:hypothetical protein
MAILASSNPVRRDDRGRASAPGPIRSGRGAGFEPRDLFLELIGELLERSPGQFPRLGVRDRLGVQLLEPACQQSELSARGLEFPMALNAHKIS